MIAGLLAPAGLSILLGFTQASGGEAAVGPEPVALSGQGVEVEVLPSPYALRLRFTDSRGRPLDAAALEARAEVRRPGAPAFELALAPPAEAGDGAVLEGPVALADSPSFRLVVRFATDAGVQVLRFPPLTPYPPFLTDPTTHTASAHAHVTPHDGWVEVVGDGHVELAFEDGCLRLFAYDRSMHPRPAGDLRAWVFLDGPERLLLSPAGDTMPPPYLEARLPSRPPGATDLVLRVARGEDQWSFRYAVPEGIAGRARAEPARLASATTGDTRVELRGSVAGLGFPDGNELEIRLIEARSRWPVELRSVPQVSLRPGSGGRLRLPAPLRLAAPGRWALATLFVPPGPGNTLEIGWRTLDGTLARAALDLPPAARRPASRGLALALLPPAVTLGAIAWRRRQRGRARSADPIDLGRLLALDPILRSRLYPAVLRWPALLLLFLALHRLFRGPVSSAENPAAWLLLGVALPLAVVLTPLVGRLFCGFCPFTAVIDLARDLLGRRRPVPGALARLSGPLASVQLVLVPLLLLAGGGLARASTLAVVLVAYLAAALIMALVYEKRAFCSVVCPAGATLSLLAWAAPHRLRLRSSRPSGADDDPCPLSLAPRRTGVPGPGCAYCGDCVKPAEPGDTAIELVAPFTAPGRESAAPGRGAALLTIALLTLGVLLLTSIHPLWLQASAAVDWRLGPFRLPAAAALAGVLLAPATVVLLAARVTGGRGSWRRRLPAEVLIYAPLAIVSALGAALVWLSRAASATPAPALSPSAILGLELGAIGAGFVLSAASLFDPGQALGQGIPGRSALAHATALLLLTLLLGSLAATAFHLALPLALVHIPAGYASAASP